MELQDCKVRVSNVDSQDSYDNIVVQVIGEMSLKAAPHRKFTQTFVLAQQPNGYFVLNDIFRYLIEEDEEEYPEEEAAEPGLTPEQPVEAESTTQATSEDTADQERDAAQVEKKLEEEAPTAPSALAAEEPLSNGMSQSSDIAIADEPPAAAVASQESEEDPIEEPAAGTSTATEDVQAERPKDPDPTPIASPPKPTKATPAPPSVPAQPSKPAAPKTWATLVASNSSNSTSNTSTPAPSTSQQQAPSQPKAAPSTQSTSSSTTSPSESRKPLPQTNGSAGWQTQEGGKRQGRQQSMSGNMSGDNSTKLGYVKNVNEKVDASLLKRALSSFGELAYFDVSRQKVNLPPVVPLCS